MTKQINLEDGQIAIVLLDRGGNEGFSLIPYHNVDIERSKRDEEYAASFVSLYVLSRGMIDLAVSQADIVMETGSDLTEEEGGMNINTPGDVSNDNATIH